MKSDSVNKKKILVAPLNWGLGHATRCVPIIKSLLKNNFIPIIASDGDALQFLRKEFPKLKYIELPSYHIQYAEKGKYLKYKLLWNSPNILKAISKEHQIAEKIIEEKNISGIISDNRFGVYSSKVPSIYITHQINVLSGSTTFLTNNIHQKIIAKFDICWVPDYQGRNSLAGKLSHASNKKLNLNYIGPISRFDQTNHLNKVVEKRYHLIVLLSGPEPQRSLLETKLLSELEQFKKPVLFVRGIISAKEKQFKIKLTANLKIKIVDFMFQNDLQKAILESRIVICRSGYTTIMDLDKIGAKVFFIPTPGQDEQQYLAKYLEEKRIAPFSSQEKFELGLVEKCNNYSGFMPKKIPKQSEELFDFGIFD